MVKKNGKARLAVKDSSGYQAIKAKIRAYPHLEEKIYLHLLLTLHENRYVSIDDIYAKAREVALNFRPEKNLEEGHNVGESKWSGNEKRIIRRLTLESTLEHLTDKDVDDLIFSVVKRDYIYALENIANLTDVSFGVLADKVREYCSIPMMTPLPKEEVMGLRVSLLRNFISDQLEFIHVAKNYLTIRDMPKLMDNTIGSASGRGRIGGKAAGMVLGYQIIKNRLGQKHGDIIRIPESYYMRTDVFTDFLAINGLTKYQNQKYKSAEEIRNSFPAVREVFRNGSFPEYAVEQCRAVLKSVGKHPLIIRSSSLLEDNFRAAFSGKYKSVFLGNQGTLKQRLSAMLAAVGEVYASGLAPDPLAYRKERDLLDYDEKLGILVQKVVGQRYNGYFLPAYAGVALSRNDYIWSPRIKSEDGLVRIVLGLGTRAVDRVGDDYPRLVGLTAPTLRPEQTKDAQKKYSQTFIDVINLQSNRFEMIPMSDLWGSERFKQYEMIMSLDEDGYLQAPFANVPPEYYDRGVVTFEDLMKKSPFPGIIRDILSTLEDAYESPVDIEFSHDGDHLYLLQTRPQAKRQDDVAGDVPSGLTTKEMIFSTRRFVPNGHVDNIEYLVYCDPRAYKSISDAHTRHQIARVVGRVNQELAGKNFILMGPGRWGSSNISLGVPVQYSEINNAKALIEIAYREGDYTPEVSFGTHFFLDLVEKGIHYLPLFPDDDDNTFNQELLDGATNMLASITPADAEYARFVKLIHVPHLGNGARLHLRMDRENEMGVAFFQRR